MSLHSREISDHVLATSDDQFRAVNAEHYTLAEVASLVAVSDGIEEGNLLHEEHDAVPHLFDHLVVGHHVDSHFRGGNRLVESFLHILVGHQFRALVLLVPILIIAHEESILKALEERSILLFFGHLCGS